jgi:hypothetical protein
MPRKSKKQQKQPQPEAPKSYDEFVDDSDSGDEEVLNVEIEIPAPAVKLRDWRDVEKFKEERELRHQVDDDLDELFDEPRRGRR